MLTTAAMNQIAIPSPRTRPLTVRNAPARVIRWSLRVPLTAKLIGANAVIVLAALTVVYVARNAGFGAASFTAIAAAALLTGVAINVFLTLTALRPIRDIEGTIMRMWRGDTDSRVASSAVADPELARIGQTLNSLLDRLERDRRAMRELASEVIRAEDREQRRIGVHLHESIAQSLASITCMLTALAAKSTDADTAERIMEIRVHVGEVLDEVDELSHDIHPRVLDDLGLQAGLRALAFDVSRPDLPVSVQVAGGRDEDLRHLGAETAAGLYRIARAAVQNALRHSGATRIDVAVGFEGTSLVLRVTDNGKGFDVKEAERRRPNKGIFVMRQRAELLNARLSVDSSPRAGTCVQVTMPVGVASLTA
jgi:two-component system sensor histidine kinase UhpB